MKLNLANPATGAQKLLDIDDEKKLRIFYDKRMAQEVKGDDLGEEFKGYVFKIGGGNDKQGFPMKQGILSNKRVKLLLSKGHSCYRPRRDGERKRKSVRGCIVGSDIAALSLVVVKRGEQEIPGLTDRNLPRRLGPKRASNIRKLFNLGKEDDVRKYVIRRDIPAKEGKKKGTSKAPKIQRLVTPITLQRKRRRLALKKQWGLKSKKEAEEYQKLLSQRQKESRDKRQELINKKRGIKKPEPAPTTPVVAAKDTGKKVAGKTQKPVETKVEPKKAKDTGAPKTPETKKATETKKAAETKKATEGKKEATKGAVVKSEEATKGAVKVDVTKKTSGKAVTPKTEVAKTEPKKIETPKALTTTTTTTTSTEKKGDTGKKGPDTSKKAKK